MTITFTLSAIIAGTVMGEEMWPGKSERISISARPRIAFSTPNGASAIITVSVPSSFRNHCVFLAWESPYPGEGGSASWGVDERSRGQFTRTIGHLTPGTTYFRADLHYLEDDKSRHMVGEASVDVR